MTENVVLCYIDSTTGKPVEMTSAGLPVNVGATTGTTPTPTSVTFSLVSTTLLAANANRKPCTKIVASLDLDGVAYIALGATATDSEFYDFLESGDSLEINDNAYTGVISMICVGSTAGSIKVTEFV